jgi:hypothetical protein
VVDTTRRTLRNGVVKFAIRVKARHMRLAYDLTIVVGYTGLL